MMCAHAHSERNKSATESMFLLSVIQKKISTCTVARSLSRLFLYKTNILLCGALSVSLTHTHICVYLSNYHNGKETCAYLAHFPSPPLSFSFSSNTPSLLVTVFHLFCALRHRFRLTIYCWLLSTPCAATGTDSAVQWQLKWHAIRLLCYTPAFSCHFQNAWHCP